MLTVKIQNNVIQVGKHFSVSFQRTLRIPDDDKTYPLPPSLGNFPICKIDDYIHHVPNTWKQHGGVFIPMYQREALWLNFSGAHWRPNIVKIAVGKVNAVTGEPWNQSLNRMGQDYIVCPDQPWLDGINAGDGYIRQFIAMPLGMGYTVEGQITGEEKFGGIQLIVFEPKKGRFPDKPPRSVTRESFLEDSLRCDDEISLDMDSEVAMAGSEMGLAAGGRMKQNIYPDKYGVDAWDEQNFGRVYVHIVNSMMYQEITGKKAPSTPVSAKTYSQHGFPWFDLYDEHKGDVEKSDTLSKVKSVKDMDKNQGFAPQQDDSSVDISDEQVKKLKTDPNDVRDGKW